MGNRLSKIYTRTGDDGTTGLGDGSRVNKTCARVEAMGNTDELNCIIGILMTEQLPKSLRETMTRVQHTLFDIGGELSIPSSAMVPQARVIDLESVLDELNEELPPLKEFILPGGSQRSAVCHLARSVCRRLERSLFAVDDGHPVSPVSLQYVNRLSDLLFVVARVLNRMSGADDVLWEHDRHAD